MENEKDKLWEFLGQAKKLDPSPWFTEQVLRQVERMEQVRVEYISFPKFFWKFATAFGVLAIAGALFLATPPYHTSLNVASAPVITHLPAPQPLAQIPLDKPLIETSADDLPMTSLAASQADVSLPNVNEVLANPAIHNSSNKIHHLDLIQTGFETASGLGSQQFSY